MIVKFKKTIILWCTYSVCKNANENISTMCKKFFWVQTSIRYLNIFLIIVEEMSK